MGKHRAAEDLKHDIIKGTQHLVAVGGMSNFSFPKLSAETGISAPTVYEHYKNKEELLTNCFLTVDGELAALIARTLEIFPTQWESPAQVRDYCWLLWNVYWRFLLEDADKTKFYWRFYNSEYYTPKIAEIRRQHFSSFNNLIRVIDAQFRVSETDNLFMLVMNLLNVTVASAVRVLNGKFENNDVTANTVFRMVFHPFLSAFGLSADQQAEFQNPPIECI